MHIETLKVFCDIIESGSFSYAASQNFVTQSAVSQQVRSLEEKYDCRLIERGRAGVKPTPAGQILYTASKEIVRALPGNWKIGCARSARLSPDRFGSAPFTASACTSCRRT